MIEEVYVFLYDLFFEGVTTSTLLTTYADQICTWMTLAFTAVTIVLVCWVPYKVIKYIYSLARGMEG